VPKRPRHAAPPPAAPETARGTSPLEVALYGVLGAVVAAGVLLVGGQPIWQPIVVVAGALGLLAVVLRSSTASRHGRRRRR